MAYLVGAVEETEFPGGLKWKRKHSSLGTGWYIGEPVTKEKLQNLEDGITIAMTRLGALKNEVGGTFNDSGSVTGSRIDTLETNLNNEIEQRQELQNRATNLESRATSLEKKVGTHTSPDADNLIKRTIDLETGLDTEITTRSSETNALRTRATTLETRATNLENRADALEARTTKIETRVAKNEDDIDILNQCCGEVNEIIGTREEGLSFSVLRSLNIHESNIEKMLLYFIYNTNAFTVKMNYNFPFLMGQGNGLSPSSISFGLPENYNQITSGTTIPHISNIEMSIIDTPNLWTNGTYTGLTKNGTEYTGTLTSFKNAFNTIISSNTNPVRISFDFYYSDLKNVNFNFQYTETAAPSDTTDYKAETIGYHRLTFMPLRRGERSPQYWPISGISTFSFDSNESATVKLNNIVITRYSDHNESGTRSSEIWTIPLPRTLYGGKIDFAAKTITSYYGHITSYQGGELPANHYPTSPNVGDEVVYRFDTDQVYEMSFGLTTYTKGTTEVPYQREILSVDY